MTPEEKYTLITRDVQEIIGEEKIKKILEKKNLKCYWGTAPSSSPSIGYAIPMLKIRDLVNAGCDMKILIADLHAFLDNLKSPFNKIQARTKYYIVMIKALLRTLGVDLSKVQFVVGSEFQLTPEVTLELFKLCSVTKVSQAAKAGTEVVKQQKDPELTSLIYPLLQALDEKFLDVDCELGGVDQRKIFAYSMDYLPKIGIEHKCAYLMNPMVPGLSTKPKSATDGEAKMSSSDPNSKIDLLDPPEVIRKKVSKAFCEPQNVEDNTVLGLFKNLVFKLVSDFTLERDEKYGGNVNFNSYQELHDAYANNSVTPPDLKGALSSFLIKFLEPIRQEFEKEENKKIYEEAYGNFFCM
jgi:tyrosyl-tRNA synthetase